MLSQLISEIHSKANPEKAKLLQRYFKTGKGEYGEGDVFLGLTVPILRELSKKYYDSISLKEIEELLDNKYHELRAISLMILILKYKKSKKDRLMQRKIYELYLKKTDRINNWDLVDISAPKIVGDFLLKNKEDVLKYLAKSSNIWEKRIAIISTFAFIKKRDFGDTLAISNMLLKDEHDLIHKAVGWALREVGKQNKKVLELFLISRYKEMPRTMLRYAIEKFPESERQKWLKGEM
jgi:3-methyladenine DNA glycosylase AlkD